MGLRVTAAQAAWLVDRHERMIRWHIERGDLAAVKEGRAWRTDVDALAGIPGWRVNRERLAELQAADAQTAASIAARLAELERQIRDLRARVARLETPHAPPAPQEPDARQGGRYGDAPTGAKPSDLALSASGDVLPNFGLPTGYQAAYPTAYRGPRTVTLADRGSGAPLRFKTKADAARWLARHGVNELTPKSWRGWPPPEMTPAAVLAFALDFQRDAHARGDWRVSWLLRRCTDEACVCRDLLSE